MISIVVVIVLVGVITAVVAVGWNWGDWHEIYFFLFLSRNCFFRFCLLQFDCFVLCALCFGQSALFCMLRDWGILESVLLRVVLVFNSFSLSLFFCVMLLPFFSFHSHFNLLFSPSGFSHKVNWGPLYLFPFYFYSKLGYAHLFCSIPLIYIFLFLIRSFHTLLIPIAFFSLICAIGFCPSTSLHSVC